MRRYPRPPAGLLATLALLAGCSSPERAEPTTSPASPSGQRTSESATSTGPMESGISPGGVTTSVSAPASSTEEEFYQACNAATVWMAEKGGDPHAQIEPYLAMLQASATGLEGSWRTPWAQLPAERQAAVIVAVTSAAEGACG